MTRLKSGAGDKVAAAKTAAVKSRKPAPKAEDKTTLTVAERAFVRAYARTGNGTRSYMAGWPRASWATANTEAPRILALPRVRLALAHEADKRQAAADLDAAGVVSRLCAMAGADERELMELHVDCCRHCWGTDGRYQYTAAEMARAEAELNKANEALIAAGQPGVQEFDPQGGPGFDPRRPPSEDCPECSGRGVVTPVFNDTRGVSAAAAMLFAGVKQTKDGLEVKLHSRADALRELGRHFGIFNDKLKLNANVAVDAGAELVAFLQGRQSPMPLSKE